MNGLFFSARFAAGNPRPIVQNLVESYTAKHGIQLSSLAVLGFDAAMVFAESIENADSTNNNAIINALQNIEFTGITGNITFDAQGNPI